MLSPDQLRQRLTTRFERNHRRWFVQLQAVDDEGPLDEWPLTVALGRPTEQDFTADPARVRAWVASWESFGALPEGVRMEWVDRHWPRLGRQRLPLRMTLDSAHAVASVLGAAPRWQRARERLGRLLAQWSKLSRDAVLGRIFDALADYTDADFDRLLALLAWSNGNSASGLYLRQLPIVGLDTKWVDGHASVCTDLLRALSLAQGRACDGADLHDLLLLRRLAPRVRVRLLCPTLRRLVGGLEDVELPVEQLAMLSIVPRSVLIVENLETGLALPDMTGVLAVMKLGGAVTLIGQVPWLTQAACVYWGDIDTHGFEILHRARSVVPRLRSVLMDAGTLLEHKALWVEEHTPVASRDLPLLAPQEREVFESLRTNRWGERVRLEQERIPWDRVMPRLRAAIDP